MGSLIVIRFAFVRLTLGSAIPAVSVIYVILDLHKHRSPHQSKTFGSTHFFDFAVAQKNESGLRNH